jgi:hypothetical protein
MNRQENPNQAGATREFARRLAVPGQHLLRGISPYNVQAAALYDQTGFAQPRLCPVCLRAFEATPARGGRPRHFCSPACRRRAADTRRRGLERVWRQCSECGVDFMALTVHGFAGGAGRQTCPPPWPASVFGPSECAHRRARRLAAEASARYRARRVEQGQP